MLRVSSLPEILLFKLSSQAGRWLVHDEKYDSKQPSMLDKFAHQTSLIDLSLFFFMILSRREPTRVLRLSSAVHDRFTPS